VACRDDLRRDLETGPSQGGHLFTSGARAPSPTKARCRCACL